MQILAIAVRVRFESGDIAQLVERMLCKHPVSGSIPLVSIQTYMLARLLLDRRRRILSSLYEPRRRVLRALIEAQDLPARLRGQAYRALLRLPRDSSPTRIRNRCPLTGRGRAIVRRFGLSRLIFRSLANAGRLVGVKKASWLYLFYGRPF